MLAPPSLACRLPPELSIDIFKLVLFFRTHSYRELARLRLKIMRLSGEWCGFLISTPDFWTDIRLAPTLPSAAVLEYVALSKGLPLHIHVDFRQCTLYHNPRLLAVNRLGLVTGLAARWSSVDIRVDHTEVYTSIRFALSLVDTPRLQRLCVQFHHTPSPTDFIELHPFRPVFILPAHFSALRQLHLRSMTLPWSSLPRLPYLDSLSLCGLTHSRCRYPSLKEFKTLVEGCTCLRFLRLHRVTFTGFDDADDIPTILSASLRDIDIAFGPDDSGRSVIVQLRLPNLECATLRLSSHTEVVYALSCAMALSAAPTLRIVNHAPPTVSFFNIFLGFSVVQHLDLTEAGESVFTELATRSKTHSLSPKEPPVLPALRSLRLESAKILDVVSFVKAHGATEGSDGHGLLLQRVQADRIWSRPSTSADVSWVRNHIAVFDVYIPDRIEPTVVEGKEWSCFADAAVVDRLT
ncbi:hypothetical protein C8R43DRAFT_1130950 [Mycena crocata]|nr:hypothetical protein C8R43DRAFT_1130950 [Mycena crocata]